MGNWRNRPRYIKEVDKNIPWIIAIDESGSPDLKYVKSLISNPSSNFDISNTHFNVTACLMKTNLLKKTETELMNLKHEFWENAYENYRTGLRRVVFHSRDIRKRSGAFNFSTEERYKSFIKKLSSTLSNIDTTIFSAHINKLEHVKKYQNPYDPYELALKFILERISFQINNEDAIIVLESRGKKEDKHLLNHIKYLIDNGSEYITVENFSFIKGVYFNQKWDKSSNDLKSYWILELADLFCYPIFKYGAYDKKDYAFNILKEKLYHYPEFDGCGIKVFPDDNKSSSI